MASSVKRANLGDTRRALGDNDEVDRDEDAEDDQADDEVAPHHELGEPGHHVAGCVLSLAAMGQDHARRRHVQREAQNCRDQQHGRKGRKIERTLDPQRDHQDQGRQRDREGKAQVDQKSGNRQDQYRHHGDDTDRERDVGTDPTLRC